MIDAAGGVRVKRLVLSAMADRHIPSIVRLSELADVGRDTLNAWFRGREPGPDAGGKVADALGLTYRDIMDAYRGAQQATETPADLVDDIERGAGASSSPTGGRNSDDTPTRCPFSSHARMKTMPPIAVTSSRGRPSSQVAWMARW